MAIDPIGCKRQSLVSLVASSFLDAPQQVKGFALRLLQVDDQNAAGVGFDLSDAETRLRYGGYPEAAYFGYQIGSCDKCSHDATVTSAFVKSVEQLRSRTVDQLRDLSNDEIALLGIADGIAAQFGTSTPPSSEVRAWLTGLVDASPGTSVIRWLAGDLVDGRGRLRQALRGTEAEIVSRELGLRSRWPAAFVTPYPDQPTRANVLAWALMERVPEGDLESAVMRLVCIGELVSTAARQVVADIDDLSALLRGVQSSMKRWVWEDKGHRGRPAARWLIDREAHVQSMLWAILYPVFGSGLRDEQYTLGYGLQQARFDIGVVPLRVIVEVKVLRTQNDFKLVEEQIAGDLGLYFAENARYERMIVFVYDDCDVAAPEMYDVLAGALRQRDERILDVIFVRRPGMIPARDSRA